MRKLVVLVAVLSFGLALFGGSAGALKGRAGCDVKERTEDGWRCRKAEVYVEEFVTNTRNLEVDRAFREAICADPEYAFSYLLIRVSCAEPL